MNHRSAAPGEARGGLGCTTRTPGRGGPALATEERLLRPGGHQRPVRPVCASFEGGVWPAFFWHTFKFFWPGTCPNRSEMAVGFMGTNFQAEPSILDPFRTMLGVLGPTWKLGLGQNVAWRANSLARNPQPGLQIPELFSGPHSGTFCL